jgi:hypothetical protein
MLRGNESIILHVYLILRGNESIVLNVYLMLRGNGVQPWALRHQQWNHPTLVCRPEEWNKKHETCVDKQISDKAVLRGIRDPVPFLPWIWDPE